MKVYVVSKNNFDETYAYIWICKTRERAQELLKERGLNFSDFNIDEVEVIEQ